MTSLWKQSRASMKLKADSIISYWDDMDFPQRTSAFQPLSMEERRWLDLPSNEGAKDLVVEALVFCIRLALVSTQSLRIANEDRVLVEFFARWYSVCYPGTTSKHTLDRNLRTAFALQEQNDAFESDSQARNVFLDAAISQYEQLLAKGAPNPFRPWRRLLLE
jgi:hypothetical protein